MALSVFLLVHAIVVSFFVGLSRAGKLYLDLFLILILILFPLLGPVSVLVINQNPVLKKGNREVCFEEAIPWLEEYNPLEEGANPEVLNLSIQHLVPFQEALLLNNAGIRRELVIDIMFEHPEQFVPLLHQARLNDDVEVVHYATTILSELNAKFDSHLQKVSRDSELNCAQATDNQLRYVNFLRRYLESGVAEGHYATSLEGTYIQIVRRLIHQKVEVGKANYQKLARLYLSQGKVAEFKTLVTTLLEKYQMDQDFWMLRLEGIVAQKSEAELVQFFETIKEHSIYFSRKNREILEIWQP